MKRVIVLMIALTSYGISAIQAQVNLTALYSNNVNLAASNEFPSLLGNDAAAFQLDILNFYSYLGTTTFNRGRLDDFLSLSQINQQDVESILGEIRDVNRFFSGVRIQPVNLAIRTSDRFAFGLGVQERPEFMVNVDGDLLQLAWQGNGPFAGQQVDLGNLSTNLTYMREVWAGASYSLNLSDNIKLRLGAKGKFIQGLASVFTDRSDFSIYTEPNGKYIDIDYDYRLNIAGNPDEVTGPESLLDFRGVGYGGDFGANLQLGRIHAAVGLVDVGAIRFTNSVTNYSAQGNYRFEGVNITGIVDTISFTDSLYWEELTNYTETNEDFQVPMPTRFSVQLAYRVKGNNVRNREFYKTSIFLTMVQGLSTESTFSDMNMLSVGMSKDLGSILNIGGNVNLYNFSQWGVGGFLSMRLLFMRVGVGTNNILPIFAPASSLRSDIHFNIGFNI